MNDSDYIRKYLRGHDHTLLLQFIEPLAEKLKCSMASLREAGLQATDFPSNRLHIKFEDGTELSLRWAIHIEYEDHVAVFTEHCGYYAWYDKYGSIKVTEETL